MFNLSNINKLFSYNWGLMLKSIFPKGNKGFMSSEAHKNIKNGAILGIVGVAIFKIAAIGIAIYTVVKAFSWLYGSEIMKFAITNAFTDSIGKWIIEIIILSIIPIIVLIYSSVMKDKQQNGWFYFIALIGALGFTIYSIYSIFGFLGAFLINPLFALLGIASLFVMLLASVNIAVGCIDFCYDLANEYNMGNQSYQGYQPGQGTTSQGYQPGQVTTSQGYQPGQVTTSQGYQPGQVTTPQGYQPGQVTTSQGHLPGQAPIQPVTPQGQQTNQISSQTVESQGYVQNSGTEQQVSNDSYKTCPNCGVKSLEKANVCFMCGTRL